MSELQQWVLVVLVTGLIGSNLALLRACRYMIVTMNTIIEEMRRRV